MLAGRRDLGNTLLIQEGARTTWGFSAWDHFLQDLRFGVRQCKRQPGFAGCGAVDFDDRAACRLGSAASRVVQLLHTDRGFTAEHVLILQTAMSGTEPADKNIAAAIYSPELDAIERIPGVKAAGFITFLPLPDGHASVSFLIRGSLDRGSGSKPRASLNAASDDFFRALRIPLLAGRFFAKTDTLGKPA